MKKTIVLAILILFCLCGCRVAQTDVPSKVSATVAGLIDNRTVEVILEDGSVKSFLFFDDEVAEKLSIAEETADPVMISFEEKEGQSLDVIVAVE